MALRLVSLLLCALIAGPLNVPAWELVRPENRVGGSPVSSSTFASQLPSQVAEPHQAKPVCGYDFASGVHKYLYAHDDPVNRVDPSGHESIGSVLTGISIQVQLRTVQFVAAHPVYTALGGIVASVAFPQLEAIPPGHPSPLDEMGQVGRIIRQGIAKGLAKFLGGIVDDMAAKLLQDSEAISDDPSTRGRQIERVAGANLAGNFEAIDDIRPGGVATQVKSIGLESGMDLDRWLMNEIRDHARELGNVDRDLSGTTHDGRRVTIRRGTIEHRVLTVAVPETHAPVVSSRAFRQALANYRSAYRVYIQVVPVRGWRK